jgi:hypothetical protein
MYHDEIFENALLEAKAENFNSLKAEISTMEIAIERFLTNILECTSSISERDFNLSVH